MNSFVRKAGSNISSFNAKNVHDAVRILKEQDQLPCYLVSSVRVPLFNPETNLTTNNTKNVSWFINSDGKIQSSKIKG